MAKKQKNLNTSCRVTDKSGNSKTYNSIEEASKDTGLSIASIKIRCNSGSIGKDKHKCEWLDEHTKRHYMAKKSKNKGARFELEVVKALKEIGYEGCTTTRAESKNLDNSKIDIIDSENKLPTNIQCKYLLNTPNYFGIREGCPYKDKPFTVIWKKSTNDGTNSKGSIAMVDLDFFYELLSCYRKIND